MWANTSPDGGLIVVGIEDEGKVSGCASVDQSHVNDVEKSPRIYCLDAKVESKRVPLIDHNGHENFVILFRVFHQRVSPSISTRNLNPVVCIRQILNYRATDRNGLRRGI